MYIMNPVAYDNSGDFLNWWFEKPRLKGKALEIFRSYYYNYERNFSGYLKQAWSDRHLELENVLNVFKDKHHIRILDLGCGTGSLTLYMACKLRGADQVLGVDINKDRLFCAKERKVVLEREVGYKIRCEFIESNVLSLSSNHKYDLIYLEETFHHLEPRLEIVRKISGLLKDNGTLVISDVNAYNPFIQICLFKKRGFKNIVKKIDEDGKEYLYGVERVIPARNVAKLFRQQNLIVKSLRHFRVANSKLANIFDNREVPIIKYERSLCKIGFLSKLISVHYNIVLKKRFL